MNTKDMNKQPAKDLERGYSRESFDATETDGPTPSRKSIPDELTSMKPRRGEGNFDPYNWDGNTMPTGETD